MSDAERDAAHRRGPRMPVSYRTDGSTSTRRKVLFVAPTSPCPPHSGIAIRTLHILAAYAGIADVAFASFYRTSDELQALTSLKDFCSEIHPVPFATTHGATRLPNLPTWRRRALGTLTLVPTIARYYYSPAMHELVSRLARSADLIHVTRLYMMQNVQGPLRQHPRPQRFILDLDDIETTRARRRMDSDGPSELSRFRAYYDLWRTAQYQRKALRLSDTVLVCSDLDRDSLGAANVLVVPNGASIAQPSLPDDSDGRTILFIGALAYQPNHDALSFFIERALPSIRAQVPGVRLLIVGSDPSPSVMSLHDGESILVAPNVSDVNDYYRQATISVVPLRVGGGTRLKILESFSRGRPVVSTSIGCEGLDVVPGHHLLVANDAPEFARACVTLLRSRDQRCSQAAAARLLVEQKYDWRQIEKRTQKLVLPMLDAPPLERFRP